MFPVEKRQRSWNEKWFDRVGTSYLTGVAVGGVWGIYDGLRSAEGTSLRLRGNSLLNGLTRRGPYMGNTFAVLGESIRNFTRISLFCSMCMICDVHHTCTSYMYVVIALAVAEVLTSTVLYTYC